MNISKVLESSYLYFMGHLRMNNFISDIISCSNHVYFITCLLKLSLTIRNKLRKLTESCIYFMARISRTQAWFIDYETEEGAPQWCPHFRRTNTNEGLRTRRYFVYLIFSENIGGFFRDRHTFLIISSV